MRCLMLLMSLLLVCCSTQDLTQQTSSQTSNDTNDNSSPSNELIDDSADSDLVPGTPPSLAWQRTFYSTQGSASNGNGCLDVGITNCTEEDVAAPTKALMLGSRQALYVTDNSSGQSHLYLSSASGTDENHILRHEIAASTVEGPVWDRQTRMASGGDYYATITKVVDASYPPFGFSPTAPRLILKLFSKLTGLVYSTIIPNYVMAANVGGEYSIQLLATRTGSRFVVIASSNLYNNYNSEIYSYTPSSNQPVYHRTLINWSSAGAAILGENDLLFVANGIGIGLKVINMATDTDVWTAGTETTGGVMSCYAANSDLSTIVLPSSGIATGIKVMYSTPGAAYAYGMREMFIPSPINANDFQHSSSCARARISDDGSTLVVAFNYSMSTTPIASDAFDYFGVRVMAFDLPFGMSNSFTAAIRGDWLTDAELNSGVRYADSLDISNDGNTISLGTSSSTLPTSQPNLLVYRRLSATTAYETILAFNTHLARILGVDLNPAGNRMIYFGRKDGQSSAGQVGCYRLPR